MIQLLKQKLVTAIKNKNEIEKNVLRVILSEIDRRTETKPISQEEIYRIIKKLILSNQECTKIRTNFQLDLENEFLATLLPKELSREEIAKYIDSLDLSKCKNVGAAIGVTMKYFKANNLYIDANIVKEYINHLYNCHIWSNN